MYAYRGRVNGARRAYIESKLDSRLIALLVKTIIINCVYNNFWDLTNNSLCHVSF